MSKLGTIQPAVKLKGVGDSLWITFDPTQSQERLKTELSQIFGRLKHLAINARIILDCGSPDDHDHLIQTLARFLKSEFDVGLVSKPPPKRQVSEQRTRKRDMDRSWRHYRSDVLMLTGRVRSGQKVDARKHLIIMGDVNPGAEIIAGGDILVMGSLRGKASAGIPDNEAAIILALDFRPEQVQIGGFVAAGISAEAENQAEFAHIENQAIVVDNYIKCSPFAKIPWPQVH